MKHHHSERTGCSQKEHAGLRPGKRTSIFTLATVATTQEQTRAWGLLKLRTLLSLTNTWKLSHCHNQGSRWSTYMWSRFRTCLKRAGSSVGPKCALAPTGRPHVHQRLHKITLLRNTLHRSSKIKLLLVLIIVVTGVVVLLLLPPVKVEALTIGQG